MSNRGKKVALETKTYEDGTVATGPAPLPDESPAEVPPTADTLQTAPPPETPAPAAAEGQSSGEAAKPKSPEKKKADKSEGKNVVVFKSANPETVAYDIRVRGIKIRPAWDAAQTHLLFDVPAELADDFALHTHVVNGRVVRAE
jgi:hypothetical protein